LSPPVGQRHLDSLAHDPDAGVGYHHVQTSKEPLGGFNHTGPAFLDADVLHLSTLNKILSMCELAHALVNWNVAILEGVSDRRSIREMPS
jgi:hypothetical protein